ncbi:MAG TPA: SpoIIE family protein phosphatase [Syntrophorhabdaceae bacterium]|jgi:sigma-B regulation protein RsbU (phosphoserine phosphatase)
MNENESLFHTPETHHTITVLLVDDQPIVGETVRRMLAPEKDILFHYCKEPTEAIRTAQETGPTVILQDLVMPDIDGLTLVKFFRAHSKLKDVPLIVLSSKEEASTKADAFAVGANDYLVKLPDRIELIARIRYHSKGYINLLEKNEAYEKLYRSQQILAAQLASAAEYVISLLPPALDEGDLRTDWRFFPSAELGGDAFGYHWIDEDRFAIYLLDVCDHGVGPALLSVSALNVLRSQSLPNTNFTEPGSVLTSLNEAFQMEKQNNLYFTIWYGVFNKVTRELRYATAGHPPALLMSGQGQVQELITPNMFIGGMEGITYTSGTTVVDLPAKLYIFSDGAYEVKMKDGPMWSLGGLKEYLLAGPQNGLSEIENLYTTLQGMQGSKDLDDDFSMLKIEFLP